MLFAASMLAALIGFGQDIIEPDPGNVPEHCWGEVQLIKDERVKDPARDATTVARMALGHAIISNMSGGARTRTFTTRVAEMVHGKPRPTQYTQAQLNKCLEASDERIYQRTPAPQRPHHQPLR